MAERGLGRGPGAGLGALFGADAIGDETGELLNVPISKVEPRIDQPRLSFDEEELEELADSLRNYGIIQPITVRKLSTGYYQIIAGERRWRAARLAEFDEVPVRVLEADDKRATEIALVENLQRVDLNPVEEAYGYRALMDEYGLTQDEAAQRVGKSRPAITNSLRLLGLFPSVLKMVEESKLSAGHARALLSLKTEKLQTDTAEKIKKQGLSVRQTEALVSRLLSQEKKEEISRPDEIVVDYISEVEKSLSDSLGRKVKLGKNPNKGSISLEYYNRDDLESLITVLKNLGNH